MTKFFNFNNLPVITLDKLFKDKNIELGRGHIISKIDIQENKGPYPIYSSSAKNNGIMGKYSKFMFDEEMITWSIDGGGKFFYRLKHKFSVTNVSGFMRAIKGKIDLKFLYNVLTYRHSFLNFDYQFKAHPSVIRELYEVPILPLAEQEKIASILTSVDEVIENTQRQINKLQDLKKAIMNELLTKGIGHTEFKDSELGRIPTSWKVLKISDLKLEIKNSIKIGPFGSSLSKKEMVTKGIKVYGQENIYKNNFKLGKYFITKNKYEKLKTCTLKSNDVIVSMMGTIGASAVFPEDAEIGIMDSHLLRIQVKENLISPNFLSNQISNYEKIYIQIRRMSQGGIMDGLNSQIIHSLKIVIPSLDEQKKILEIIDSIQVSLSKSQYKLKQYQSLKKSLMQELLTGKVRVPVN